MQLGISLALTRLKNGTGSGGGGGGGGAAPVNTVAPALSGSFFVGQTLTCSTGTWTGDPVITYTYQWRNAGVNIGGATTNSYVVQAGDDGDVLDCVVTGTNGVGNSSVASNSYFGIATGIWLDAADTSTIAPGATFTFTSKSPGGGAAVQGTGSAQPVSGTRTLNLLNTLDFDGSTDFLDLSAFNATISNTNYTIFYVYASDNAGVTQRLLTFTSSASTAVSFAQLTTQQEFRFGNTSSTYNLVRAADTNGHIQAGRLNGTSRTFYFDSGTAVSSDTNGNNGLTYSSTARLGASAGGSFFNGRFAEFIVPLRALSDAEMEQVGDYLAIKWGLQWGSSSNFISNVWTGDVTTDGVTLSIVYPSTPTTSRVVLSENSDMSNPSYVTLSPVSDFLRTTLTGLSSDTLYYYRIECNGVMDTTKPGRFRTIESGSALSFRFCFASCCETAVRGGISHVFDQICNQNPLFFQQMGDFDYDDYNGTDVNERYIDMNTQLGNQFIGSLLRNVPIYYNWDDHDFCGNASNGTFAGRDTAITSFRTRVPSPTLAASGATDAVYFTKTIGRVVFITLDQRSDASPQSDPDNASKTRVGTTQKAWWKSVLAANATGKLIVIFAGVPWDSTSNDDTWWGYSTERTEMADYMKSLSLQGRVIMVAGDGHFIGFDDGTNSDYATSGGMATPVFQAAPLNASSHVRGGPYSGGTYTSTDGGNYGMIDITDSGGSTINVEFNGINVTAGVQKNYSFVVNV
jgi:phosphodiesterase/alkaline phosphatase D-like protein